MSRRPAALNPKYAYGTPEEVANRIDDGYPDTESHFNQIRPDTNPTAAGNIDEKGSKTPAGQPGLPQKSNGNLGRGA